VAVRVFPQTAQDFLLQIGGHGVPEILNGHQRFVGMGVQHLDERGPLEHQLAGREEVGHRGDAVNVAATMATTGTAAKPPSTAAHRLPVLGMNLP
jgi:hypothetical protein